MNFISAGSQKPDVMTLLPLSGADAGAPSKTGAAPAPVAVAPVASTESAIYEFSPDPPPCWMNCSR